MFKLTARIINLGGKVPGDPANYVGNAIMVDETRPVSADETAAFTALDNAITAMDAEGGAPEKDQETLDREFLVEAEKILQNGGPPPYWEKMVEVDSYAELARNVVGDLSFWGNVANERLISKAYQKGLHKEITRQVKDIQRDIAQADLDLRRVRLDEGKPIRMTSEDSIKYHERVFVVQYNLPNGTYTPTPLQPIIGACWSVLASAPTKDAKDCALHLIMWNAMGVLAPGALLIVDDWVEDLPDLSALPTNPTAHLFSLATRHGLPDDLLPRLSTEECDFLRASLEVTDTVIDVLLKQGLRNGAKVPTTFWTRQFPNACARAEGGGTE